MGKKIFFILIILLAALFPSACSGNTENTETKADTALEKTPPPSLIDKTFIAVDRYCIAGRGEEGAAIRVEGGVKPASGIVIDGQFIVEVFLEKQTSREVTLNLYAKSEDKAESDPLTVTVGKREVRESKPVYVGKENHLHYNETINDFLGKNSFLQDDLDLIKQGAENLQQTLTDAGLNTKIIIFIPPNHSTVYPETMPDWLIEKKIGDNSRLKQLEELLKNSTVKFITPYDRLMKEKENYFLYNRTDTHWNELGAYFGYCELFNYISETFPDAAPKPMEDFDIYKAVVNGGDLIPMLKFDQTEYIENTYIVRIKNSTVRELFRDDTNEIAYQESKYHEFQEYNRYGLNPDASTKPTILMYRDSYSISMMSPMAETSKRIVFYNMWDYNIDINYVKEVNPDFLIIEKVERLLYDLPGVFRPFK